MMRQMMGQRRSMAKAEAVSVALACEEAEEVFDESCV